MNFIATIELLDADAPTIALLVTDAADATEAENRAWEWMAEDGDEVAEVEVREATAEDEERMAGLAV